MAWPNPPRSRAADAALEMLPPYELTSDMLFAFAACPTRWLRDGFPGVPFASWFGRTPVAMWFARVLEALFDDPSGARGRIGEPDAVLYNELTILALLRGREMFAPHLYVSTELSLGIAQLYGMPKSLQAVRIDVLPGLVTVDRDVEGRTEQIRARRLGTGRVLARWASRLLPWTSRPVRFPSGAQVRGRALAAPCVQLAWSRHSCVDLHEPWWPEPLQLQPIGLYAPGLVMQLPPP